MIDETLLDEFDAQPLGPFVKGWPLDDRFASIADLRAQRPTLAQAGFVTPFATLDADAVDANLRLMARFCRQQRVVIAPHGKTTMAPRLFARQMAAGAWGITVATPYQLRVARHVGVERILLANQLTDPGALVWLGRELEQAQGPIQVLSYVDNPAEVSRAQRLLTEAGVTRPLDVLVELGHVGGRAGCRDLDEVLAVARQVVASPAHRLVGIAGYEGTLGATTDTITLAKVKAYLADLVAAYRLLRDAGLLEFEGDQTQRPVLSAGGSIYFDAVVEAAAGLRHEDDPLVILRSGGYLVHDDLLYRDSSPFSRGADLQDHGLVAALEVRSRVLSRPEPELAIIDAGRRDVPHDAGLPLVRAVWRDGSNTRGVGISEMEGSGGPEREPVEAGSLQVVAVNDQHGFVRIDPELDLVPGDVLALGVSHPCTLFDKWRVLPLVSGEHVVDAIRTWF